MTDFFTQFQLPSHKCKCKYSTRVLHDCCQSSMASMLAVQIRCRWLSMAELRLRTHLATPSHPVSNFTWYFVTHQSNN